MTENIAPSQPPRKPPARLSTGIEGLDRILAGGFVRSSSYIILGTPGSGKTILANQVCFNHIANGGRALYVTLLAETHNRMLANLEGLDFYNPTAVTNSIYYISGYQVLQRDGLRGLTEMVRKEIRQRQATILVLDGLTTAEAVSQSSLDFKSFIDQLHVYTEMNGCTTFLLSHRGIAEPERGYRPEYTMVDGIIELHDVAVAERNLRELFVSKFRGGPHIAGRHLFEITNAGLAVYPRTESILRITSDLPDTEGTRRDFGVAELDRMLSGGLPQATTTMVLGVSGSGKTILGLQFLAAGAAQGEPCVYFGFHESPRQLIGTARGIGLTNFENDIENGLIEIIWQSPLEGVMDILAERLLTAVKRRGVKRVVIDSFQGFEQAYYPERLTRFFTALDHELQLLGVTSLILIELHDLISPTIQIPVTPVSTIFNNIILLRYTEFNSQLVRLLSIIKERGSSFDPTIRLFTIGANGIVFTESVRRVEGLITGQAHQLDGRLGMLDAATSSTQIASTDSDGTEPA